MILDIKILPYISFILLINLPITNYAQQNARDIDKFSELATGKELFDHQLYGLAAHQADRFLYLAHPMHVSDLDMYKIQADLLHAVCDVRLNKDEVENRLTNVIMQYRPDPTLSPATSALANYYYNEKQYAKAIETYDKLSIETLPTLDMSEASFKKGYCHFVLKEFGLAQKSFAITKDLKNEYFYPTNYYYGMCEYFQNKYADAVTSFQKVKGSDVYRSFIPYYLTQIYFAKNEPEKVIASGEVALKDPELRNRKEIRQLLGQAYFQRKEYELALPHLAYYEENTDKLTIDEFYQLSFTQYQLKDYKNAVETFKELSLLDSKLGQVVNYYMADCYKRLGDLVSARASFKKVSQMTYNTGMQEESTFNYGKLSAEAGFEREAINTLVKLDSKSPYYQKSKDIINDILEHTSDYASAIKIIEGMSDLTEKLKNTYQQVTYKQGLVHFGAGELDMAQYSFAKVKKYKNNKKLSTEASYWIGLCQHKDGDYQQSAKTLEEFFVASNGAENLDPISSASMGHYIQGYNYLALKNYKNAEINFKNTIVGFGLENSDAAADKKMIGNIVSDAQIRTGDCLFKNNDYKNAQSYYIKAIEAKNGSFVYAMYQKAIIEGLLDEPFEKIVTLKDLVTKHPMSEYADDAYIHLGDTYLQNDNIDNAYNAYATLIEKYPNSNLKNAAKLQLGLIAYNKGDLTAASDHYKGVLSANPSKKEIDGALLGLKEIYINDLGTPDQYISIASTVPGSEITASMADSLAFSVGQAKYDEGDYEKAVAGLNNYIDKYPNGLNKISATYLRAESYTLLKKFSQAFPDYEWVADRGSSEYYSPALKKSAIIAYNHTKNFDKAMKYYSTYYDLITDDAEKLVAALGAMRSAFKLQQSETVEKYATIVSKHGLSNNDDKTAAAYYLGKVYQKSSQWDKSKAQYKKVESLTDNQLAAEARYQIADITYQQGKLNEAEKLIEAANDKNGSYATWIVKGLLLLSDIYIQRNDLLNARAAVEAIVENFKDDDELLKAAETKLKQIATIEQQKNRIKATPKNSLELSPSGKN
jgi:tetratricopeptide (TPR) repeat protein